jgi:hypothetical protein
MIRNLRAKKRWWSLHFSKGEISHKKAQKAQKDQIFLCLFVANPLLCFYCRFTERRIAG